MVPAYSAFSQRNIKPEDLEPGSKPENQQQVIYMNYGRLEDYEEFSYKNEKTQQQLEEKLKDKIIIVR